MIILTYQDRESDVVGLNQLLLSLTEKCLALRVVVFCPDVVRRLLRAPALSANVTIRDSSGIGAEGWSVKPELLLTLLDEGHAEVLWIDSDIIATGDFY